MQEFYYAARWIGVAIFAASFFAGCIHQSEWSYQGVDFNATLIDGVTSEPLDDVQVAVWSGDQLIYEGKSDREGVLRFHHKFKHNEKILNPVGVSQPPDTLTVVLTVEAGDCGVLEIPVNLNYSSGMGSLGELRLVPKEGP